MLPSPMHTLDRSSRSRSDYTAAHRVAQAASFFDVAAGAKAAAATAAGK